MMRFILLEHEPRSVVDLGSPTYDRQNNVLLPTKDVRVLIPRICECVTICGKKVFGDVIKTLKTGRLSWIWVKEGSRNARVRKKS